MKDRVINWRLKKKDYGGYIQKIVRNNKITNEAKQKVKLIYFEKKRMT